MRNIVFKIQIFCKHLRGPGVIVHLRQKGACKNLTALWRIGEVHLVQNGHGMLEWCPRNQESDPLPLRRPALPQPPHLQRLEQPTMSSPGPTRHTSLPRILTTTHCFETIRNNVTMHFIPVMSHARSSWFKVIAQTLITIRPWIALVLIPYSNHLKLLKSSTGQSKITVIYQ